MPATARSALSPGEWTLSAWALRSEKCQQETHAPHKRHSYSITSSARASSVGGTMRPSILAVLRLMTSSNLVGT